jgi:hypothetical protein
MQFPHNLEQSDYIIHNNKKYIPKDNLINKLINGLNVTKRRITNIGLTENIHIIYPVVKINKSNRKRALITIDGVKHIIDNLPNTDIDMDSFYDFCINWSLENDRNINIDNAHYVNKCAWVYLLHIKDNLYKYGETYDINRRMKCHKNDLEYIAEVDKIPCSNKTVARRAEQTFSHHLRSDGILTKYTGNMQKEHVEIFTTDNINKYLYILRDIVQAENDRYMRDFPGIQAVRLDMIKESNKQKELMLHETAANIEHAVHTIANEKVSTLNSLMKDMLDKNDMTTSKLELMRNELNRLIENSESETAQKINNMTPITITRGYNKPFKGYDIPLDPIYKFVQNCVNASPGKVMTNSKFFDRMIKTPYCRFYEEYKGDARMELNVHIYAVLNTLLGVNCKTTNRDDKDYIFNIDFKVVPVEEFIDIHCLQYDGVSEFTDDFKNAYEKYCKELEIPFSHISMVNQMKKYKTKQTTNNRKMYVGLILKNNSVDNFIRSKCEFHPDYKLKIMKFMDYYGKHCIENDMYKHSLSTVKLLLNEIYKIKIIDGGHETKLLVGIKIIGVNDVISIKQEHTIEFNVEDFTKKHLARIAGNIVDGDKLAPAAKFYLNNDNIPDRDIRIITKMILNYHNATTRRLDGFVLFKNHILSFVDRFIDKTKNGITKNTVALDRYNLEYNCKMELKEFTKYLMSLGYKKPKRYYKDNGYSKCYDFVLIDNK